jgi:hypothetical protein
MALQGCWEYILTWFMNRHPIDFPQS